VGEVCECLPVDGVDMKDMDAPAEGGGPGKAEKQRHKKAPTEDELDLLTNMSFTGIEEISPAKGMGPKSKGQLEEKKQLKRASTVHTAEPTEYKPA